MNAALERMVVRLRRALPGRAFRHPIGAHVRPAQELGPHRGPRGRETRARVDRNAGRGCRGPHAAGALAGPRRTRNPVLHTLVLAGLLVPACISVARAAPADSTAARPAWPTARVRAWQTGALRPDRLQHASLSFALAAAASTIGGRDGAAFAGTLLLGVGKEAWDARGGRFDTRDLAGDLAGAALGTWAGSAIRR